MQTYQDLTGPPQVVQSRIADLYQRRRLLAMTPPELDGDGWRVRVWVRASEPRRPTGTPPARRPQRALPPPPEPWQWPGREHAGRIAAGLGITAVAGAVVWIVWQAVRSATDWAGDHTGQLVGVGGLAALAVLAWLRWKLRRPACPGHVHHCNGCRSH